jgi:hypothetical protein
MGAHECALAARAEHELEMIMSERYRRDDERLATERHHAQPRADAAREKPQHTFENSQCRLDRRLDQALEETFPASDPVAVFIGI